MPQILLFSFYLKEMWKSPKVSVTSNGSLGLYNFQYLTKCLQVTSSFLIVAEFSNSFLREKRTNMSRMCFKTYHNGKSQCAFL